MKTWLRLLLVTATVGGGFTGIILTLDLFHNLKSPAQALVVITFLILFSFVTASGLLLVEKPNRTGPVLVALALQIPWISCPVFVYQFATGMHAAITLGTPEDADRVGLHLGWNLLFGTHFQFRIGTYHERPWAFGVNLVGLLLFVLLLRSTRSFSAKPHPGTPTPSDSIVV